MLKSLKPYKEYRSPWHLNSKFCTKL
uniref:Uncharacterized protein n=1 Tax=Arundo donax TaxID=35708 RepID=A0A0A8Y5A1_ARUDO